MFVPTRYPFLFYLNPFVKLILGRKTISFKKAGGFTNVWLGFKKKNCLTGIQIFVFNKDTGFNMYSLRSFIVLRSREQPVPQMLHIHPLCSSREHKDFIIITPVLIDWPPLSLASSRPSIHTAMCVCVCAVSPRVSCL